MVGVRVGADAPRCDQRGYEAIPNRRSIRRPQSTGIDWDDDESFLPKKTPCWGGPSTALMK